MLLVGVAILSDLLRDPNEPVAIQPRDDGPTYYLRVPRVSDRANFRHEVAARGGRTWSQLDLVTTAKQAVERLLPGEEYSAEKADTLDILNAYAEGIMAAILLYREDRSQENIEAVNAALVMNDEVLETFETLSIHDRTLARRMADAQMYQQKAGPVAAEMFLVGWEGEGLPEFKRSKLRGLDERLLEYIPTGDLVAISARIHELLEPSEAKLGNSASGSAGTSSQEPSKAEKKLPKKTRSSETSGISTGSAAA